MTRWRVWILDRKPSIAREGLFLSAAFWIVFFGIALIRDGTIWPHPLPPSPSRNLSGVSSFEAWEGWALVWLVIEATFLASWGIFRRSRQRDGLVWSLVAFFGAFAVLFLWSMAAFLYDWETTPWVRRIALRWPLVLTLAVLIWNLSRLPDTPGDRAVMRYGPREDPPGKGFGTERDEQTGTQDLPQTVYERRSGTDRRAGWGKL